MTKASDNAYPSVLVVEGSAPSSPSAGNQRVYIDSADHVLKRKNSSGTVTTIESSGLLGSVAYKKGSDGSIGNTTSTSLTDVDATNAIVTFTAPASGHVIVHISTLVGIAAGGGAYLGLRESSSQVGTQVYCGSLFDNKSGHMFCAIDVTGISAGSHTYKLAFKSAGAQIDVYGGPTFGDLVLEVWSAA